MQPRREGQENEEGRLIGVVLSFILLISLRKTFHIAHAQYPILFIYNILFMLMPIIRNKRLFQLLITDYIFFYRLNNN